MGFLVVVGVLQFVYCILAGNYVRYFLASLLLLFGGCRERSLSIGILLTWPALHQPFNAFLSGFSAAVGQFVLTASLRMQTSDSEPTKSSSKQRSTGDQEAGGVSSERYVYPQDSQCTQRG